MAEEATASVQLTDTDEESTLRGSESSIDTVKLPNRIDFQLKYTQEPPDYRSMPPRQYVEEAVMPVLMHGLQVLARERPADPITFLSEYLLKNKQVCTEKIPPNL